MQKGALKGIVLHKGIMIHKLKIVFLLLWNISTTHGTHEGKNSHASLFTPKFVGYILLYRFSNPMVKSRNSCTGLDSCWKTDISLGSAKNSFRITICQTLSKKTCSYFSTSSKCRSEEIANKIPKAILPNRSKEQLWLYILLGTKCSLHSGSNKAGTKMTFILFYNYRCFRILSD